MDENGIYFIGVVITFIICIIVSGVVLVDEAHSENSTAEDLTAFSICCVTMCAIVPFIWPLSLAICVLVALGLLVSKILNTVYRKK